MIKEEKNYTTTEKKVYRHTIEIYPSINVYDVYEVRTYSDGKVRKIKKGQVEEVNEQEQEEVNKLFNNLTLE